MTERRRRSYSQLSVFQECPEQYFHKYVQRIPEEPAVWSIGGTAFHEVAERYLRGELGDRPTGLEIHEAWLTAWDNALAEVRERNPDAPADVDKWRKANRGAEGVKWWMTEGPDMVARFVLWWGTSNLQVAEIDGQPALELRLEVDLGGVPVVVIPDALVVDEHGQLDVLDYKSGKPPKKSLQLGVYKAGVEAATGLVATFGLYYMTRPSQALPVDLSRWEPAEIGRQFAEFDEMANAGQFPPRPGEACRYCPYKKELCSVRGTAA